MHALIVIPDPDRARKLGGAMAELGYVVQFAASAEHAHVLMRAQQPELIVIDLVQPRASGLVFAERLHADTRVCDIALIALTCIMTDDVARVATEIGFLDCLDDKLPAVVLAEVIRERHARAAQRKVTA